MHRATPLVLLAAALAALAALLPMDVGTPAGKGTFPIEIIGPDGPLFNGTVQVENATAYTVLLAAASQADFDVEATGAGDRLFIVRIGPYENSGAGGWCYAVWEDGWVQPGHSAGIAGLQDGQAVRWVYAPEGCTERE